MSTSDPIDIASGPADAKPVSADDLNFGGSHIAACNRYGDSLKITLASGQTFSPKFPNEESCKGVMRQVQFAINTGTLVHISAGKA